MSLFLLLWDGRGIGGLSLLGLRARRGKEEQSERLLTGCEGPDSRPERDVAKLVDHLVVVLRELILREGYFPPYALKEFAFVAHSCILIVLKSDTLFLRVVGAWTRQRKVEIYPSGQRQTHA